MVFQMSELDGELDVIRRFHYLLTNSETFWIQGSPHPHPYINAVMNRRHKLKEELEELQYSAGFYRSPEYSVEDIKHGEINLHNDALFLF